MVKVEKSPEAPVSLAVEKAKKSGSCREPDVTAQLDHDFHGKCYLCEINELQDPEVEHLKAHGGDQDLKFDWNNLFLSCGHCNGIKNQKAYERLVLDCSRIDPERHIRQELIDGRVRVLPLDEEECSKVTADLIVECFEKRNTGIRLIGCNTRIKALKETMNGLYRALQKHRENPSVRTLRTLRGMLDRSYKFAGFTRTYVRMHIEDYPDLQEYIAV